MIYTITFNPALDYISQVDNFEVGKINRTKTEEILSGGKGLNVSTVLSNLGIESTALGFIAGFTGEELKKNIEEKGIKTDFINVKKGITRINVKISSKARNVRINGNGPEITEENIKELIEKIDKIKSEDKVILAGNIPKCINNNIYEIICKKLNEKNVLFIVDATKELLMNVLKFKPFLIKPNKEELEETFNEKIESKEEIIEHAKKLQKMGAQNVLVSLGGDGAILVTNENEGIFYKCSKGKGIKYGWSRRLHGSRFYSWI